MKIDLKNLTITKAHEALNRGDFTSVELTQAYLDVIAAKNKDINAYLEVFSDALDAAKKADKKIEEAKSKKQDFFLLTGIPVAIKDNILIKGKIASAASKMLENYHSTYNATVISKLGREGAVFIGRTNMDEFAMGGSTENSAFGVTKNPHDLSRVAGGSSGGSAAAVAMDGALFALGTDTGGSIRQPASFCGAVGLKTTYGAVSRYGAIAMGSSLDQIGPITKSVTDAEIVFNVIKGKDIYDSTTIDESTYAPKRVGTKKPIIGVPRDFFTGGGVRDGIARDVMTSFENGLNDLKEKGYEIKDVSLPNIAYSLPVYYVVMPAEVSSNLARYDGVKYGLHVEGKNVIDDYFETRRAGFGKEVIRRILLGTYVLSSGYHDAYYNRANAVRAMITQDFIKAFESVDIIATPTTPAPAFKIGEKVNDPVAMYLEDIFTVTANITGMPALTVPCGFAEREGKKLPLGLQLTARHGDEKTLFGAGKEFLGNNCYNVTNMEDEEKESGGGNEAVYVVIGLLVLIAIAPFVLSTLNPDAIPFVTYFMSHWGGYVITLKKILGWIVGISFPISIGLLIMIVYTVERLKEIRNIEKNKFDLPIEQAYTPVDTEGDPAMVHRWSTVTTHIESNNPNDWKQAILEADIMLDDLLTNLGYRGDTIGEKLKRIDSAHFKTLQDAWDGHTVRNKIAHEGSAFDLNQIEARRVVQQYRKVFEEFYFI